MEGPYLLNPRLESSAATALTKASSWMAFGKVPAMVARAAGAAWQGAERTKRVWQGGENEMKESKRSTHGKKSEKLLRQQKLLLL